MASLARTILEEHLERGELVPGQEIALRRSLGASSSRVSTLIIRQALLPIGLFGVVAVLGLFMYEVRGIQDCTFLRKRAGAIEQQLKMHVATTQFNSRPAARFWGFADEIGAGWIVYGAVIAAWLFVAGYGVFGEGGLCGARRPGGLVAVGAAATLVFILMVAGSCWSRTDEREDGQGGPRGRSPDNV